MTRLMESLTPFQRAALMMTREQMLASWVREQEYHKARGLPHYTTLRDPETGAVLAQIGA